MNKNVAMNFWFPISVGSNIYLMCITFAYASFWKTFAKQEIFICIIIWLHLHIHAGANRCITSIKNSHMYLLIRHLHHKKFSICTIIWPHSCLHSWQRFFALDIPGANIYITCIHIRICIRMKDICIIRTKIFICTF